jgi:hypothetical protein
MNADRHGPHDWNSPATWDWPESIRCIGIIHAMDTVVRDGYFLEIGGIVTLRRFSQENDHE